MKSYTLKFRAVDKVNFENLRNGIKSIETRAASVRYQSIAEGDELIFSCDGDTFSKIVAKKYHWPSLDAMVKEIDFRKVMPMVNSVEEMKKRYASYPDYEQKIKEFGLLGFEFA